MVESKFRTIFCAVPAFMRVEPAIASGPVSGTIAICASRASGERAIRCDADRDGSAASGKLKRAENVGRGAAGRYAHDYIALRESRSREVARAVRRGIFRAFHRAAQRSGTACNQRLDHLRSACQTSADTRRHREPRAGRLFPRRCKKVCRLFACYSRSRPPPAQFAAARAEQPAPRAHPRDSERAEFRAWIFCRARASGDSSVRFSEFQSSASMNASSIAGRGVRLLARRVNPLRDVPRKLSSGGGRRWRGPRDSKIASWRAGRTWRILLFSRVGFTRLVSRMTKSSRSGSIQSDVPVNPCGRNCAARKYWPGDGGMRRGTSQPSARAESPIAWRAVNSSMVARETTRW